MRTRVISPATAVVTLIGGSALAIGMAAPAFADSIKPLAVDSVGDVVVDGVHDRVLVVDPTGGKVVSTGFDGTVEATHALAGVSDLALSTDAQLLYAASESGNAIVALDPVTLVPAASYSTGEIAPLDVAFAGGKVWFTYGSNLGSIDPAAETPEPVLDQAGTGWSGAAKLASTANRLAAASYSTVTAFDVSDGTAKQLGTTAGNGGTLADISLSADGETIGTVSGGVNQATLYDVANLAAARRFDLFEGGDGAALDIAADGAIATAVGNRYGPAVEVFTPAGQAKIRQYTLTGTGVGSDLDVVQPRALAWEPDGTRLFAVSKSDAGTFAMRVFTEPRKSQPTLTLSGPSKATRATTVTITGTLKAPVPLPAGTTVTVKRLDLDNPAGAVLASKKTDANGKFTITDKPWAGGKVTYRVAFAGSATHGAVTADKVLDVTRTSPTLTLNRNKQVFKQGQTVQFTAHLGSTYKNRSVAIYADPYGSDQAPRLLRNTKVNSKGDLATSLRLTRNTAVWATFSGDSRYAAKTTRVVVSTKVNITNTLSGYYKTAKIGGTSYRHYRVSKPAIFNIAVTPYPGRLIYVEVQYYSGGKWRVWGNQYFTTANGRAVIYADGSYDLGVRLRVKVSYRSGGAGADSVNATTFTGLSYFTFTR
ncbi:hypothetical protein [Paractinoplanes maris]|uniref:hypothetical protein n=1 Tax=Paractinoplanes maris TaxID=1734446 RepID=UPI00202133CC|nr:hypothetical protein [Actinoplanes maris]